MYQRGYLITELVNLLEAKVISRSVNVPSVFQLYTDSRNFIPDQGALFVALRGTRNDGHSYVHEIYEKGGRLFLISDSLFDYHKFPDAWILLVSDTLKALQKIAAFHRSHFQFPVIGVTGSNGKTIVKEWLYQLLKDDFEIVRSPKSYNSQVGVPLSLWQINKEHNLGIFEAGISRPGEMLHLGELIQPDIGVFTHFGQAHAENFTGDSQKAEEKALLFKNAGKIVYCRDYDVLHQIFRDYPSNRIFSWSRKNKADLLITKVVRNQEQTDIQAICNNDFVSVSIPFYDEASIENAITCWACLLAMGQSQEKIASGMKELSTIAMRLEVKEGINQCKIINDTYNSDIDSLKIALDFLSRQQQYEKKCIIISDLLETGKAPEALYAEVSRLFSHHGIRRMIGIGQIISEKADLFQIPEKLFFTDTESFLTSIDLAVFHRETILVKGARSFGMERIIRRLQQKAHETVLEINLDALASNINYFKTRLLPDVRLMAVVKAFGYGSGSIEIGHLLEFNRLDYLAVAYADEGVELRNAGIDLPVMVMNPDEQSFELMLAHALEPEIFSLRNLDAFLHMLKSRPAAKNPFAIHLKLDTGMHRLGFMESELDHVILRLRNQRNVKIATVFSHLAASDEPEHDDFTRMQADTFRRMCASLKEGLGSDFCRHLLNTGGVSRWPDLQFEMVRLGIGMHGISGCTEDIPHLLPTTRMKTVVSQLRHLKAGETVGYSRKGMLKHDALIATVPVGYADGFSRKLGNGKGHMLVAGKPAYTVGNICMDMCMIDVTGIDVREGDEVTVFGDGYSVSELARDMETIPYEVLASVSSRVKRVYYHE